MNLAEIKARWAAASPSPWRMGSNWRRIFTRRVLLAEIPASSLGVPQEKKNAVAIRNAASDVAWLIAEVERLSSVKALYEPLWEESY